MMTVRIQTPSRLHFGLLGWGPESARQFGGVGLMIDKPGLELVATPSDRLTAEGPLAERALKFASRAIEQDSTLTCAHLQILHAPPEHIGLGTGTQLGLAVARALTQLSGRGVVAIERLAELSGRGLRSGIGLHGFEQGGLLVDGGRRSHEGIPSLIARHAFPAHWGVVLVIPQLTTAGLHGNDEVQAFARLPPIPPSVTDRLCRRVVLGLLPAVVEHDLAAFGEAIEAIQGDVGACFASAQGGIYAHSKLYPIVDWMRLMGLQGVGQSSWGPALYGFFDRAKIDQREQEVRLRTLSDQFECKSIFTQAAVCSDHSLI